MQIETRGPVMDRGFVKPRGPVPFIIDTPWVFLDALDGLIDDILPDWRIPRRTGTERLEKEIARGIRLLPGKMA